tara:strand:+ start:3609 stop:3803 length:195 start_codon:yes stop_codon:yes gene_type:complete
MYIAKPNLKNKNNTQEFSTLKDAVRYLEDTTGYEMSYYYPRGVEAKFENRVYDWELVGKLIKKL